MIIIDSLCLIIVDFMRVNYFNSVEFKTVLPVALN